MKSLPRELTTVTRTSKFLALVLFIVLPAIAFYLGWQYGTIATLMQSDAQSESIPYTPSIPKDSTPTPPVSEVLPTPPTTTPGNPGSNAPYPGDDTPTPPPATDVSCGITNCHGTPVTCGDVSDPIACTMEYRIGDFCRQYMNCEVVANSCQAVTDPRYNTCVSCVAKCTSEDPENAFTCEDTCRAALE